MLRGSRKSRRASCGLRSQKPLRESRASPRGRFVQLRGFHDERGHSKHTRGRQYVIADALDCACDHAHIDHLDW
ncbi:Protein of unknown function [Gryllus bimaculatus]|nr:Protein of unknown function [Gryllus bimaculatus]